jgi:hypothetical protein
MVIRKIRQFKPVSRILEQSSPIPDRVPGDPKESDGAKDAFGRTLLCFLSA